jgi:two-component system, OmpR family, sensor histidine kinase KdpD
MTDRLRGHAVDVDIPADFPLLVMDSVLIGQVLVNLLDNACKYAPAGSQVSVAGRVEGQQVLVSVRDSGPGIPEEDLERVFDKFYRVQRPTQALGTGLGLSICKGIVEAHGGRIWAENNPTQGLAVVFTLPYLRETVLQKGLENDGE